MNDSKKVSIVVPVYKSEKYLRKLIESMIKQTYSNIEIILVDDGSPDNSGVICDEYANKDSRILVIHKENGGTCDARNTGLKKASGYYLMFADGDDWLEEDCVEYLVKLIEDKEKFKIFIITCFPGFTAKAIVKKTDRELQKDLQMNN